MKRTITGEMVGIIAVLGLGVLSMSILQPVLPLYLTTIGVVPTILGLMFSTAMVGMAIGESFWGWVADRLGLRIPLSVGTFVCALAVLLLLTTRGITSIFTIFFFWGFVRSALFGPGRGYIGAHAPPLKKATFMAIITVMLSASRSIGALPSGFIVDTLGYQGVFFISGGIAVAAGLIVITRFRRTRLVQPELLAVSSVPSDERSSLGQAFSYRPLTSQCAVTALSFLGLGVLITFLPLLATQVVGVGPAAVGILFTINGVTTTVLGIPMGMLADRKGKRALMMLGLLVSASAMGGMAFVGSFNWLIVFVILASLGMAMFSPAALGLFSDAVPLHRQSTAMGIYGGACENTGIIAGSALGGFVWSTWGPQTTFLIGTFSAILGAMLCFTLTTKKVVSANP